MQDHRKDILDAGMAILQEQGLAGLTQPKIAARTGLRQSHLTYYYPTRADLVTAVARVGIEAIVLLMVVAAPWMFGAVHPVAQLVRMSAQH